LHRGHTERIGTCQYMAPEIASAKGVNAPIAAYAPVCPSMVRVNTMGVTVADMTMLPYKNRRKPMFPFEKNTMLGAKP